jgi:hypothetical protein
MVVEPAGPPQAALRTLSTGSAGTLSERARTVPALGGATGAVRRLSGTLSERSRERLSVLSRPARDAVSPRAGRLSEGAGAVVSDDARAVVSDATGAVVSVAACADAGGGAIKTCETDMESAKTMWCQGNMKGLSRTGRQRLSNCSQGVTATL